MADAPVLVTKRLTRQMLAKFLPNHESIKAFESLIEDVTEGLPGYAEAAFVLAEEAKADAGSAQATATTAESLANTAQTTADAAALAVGDLEMALMQQFSVIYDQDAEPPTVAYLCEALPGAVSSDPSWRVQRFTFGVDGDIAIEWADGNPNFDNIADDRATLTYS